MLPKHAEYQAFLRPASRPHFSPHRVDCHRCATAWNKQCSLGSLRRALLVPSSGTRCCEMRTRAPAGVEPALPPCGHRRAAVVGGRLPLHHGRVTWCAELSKNLSVVALRVELGATRLSAEFWQPALDYPFVSVTRTGVEPVLPPTNLRSVPEGRRPQTDRLAGPCVAHIFHAVNS